MEHEAWDHAFLTVTTLRSTNQAKILQRAHAYAVKYYETGPGRQYGKDNSGKLPYVIIVDPENPSRELQRPNVPKTSTFPEHFMSIATASDVLYDVKDGIDWDGLYRKRDRSQPLNHLGRGLVNKVATYIQAEILNALCWVNADGIYRRPTILKNKKMVDEAFKRNPTVMKWIHDADVFARVTVPCPLATKRIEEQEIQGGYVSTTKVPQVGCLYPVPKKIRAPRHRNVTITSQELDYIHEDALVADHIRDSDIEDESDDEEDESSDDDDDFLENE